MRICAMRIGRAAAIRVLIAIRAGDRRVGGRNRGWQGVTRLSTYILARRTPIAGKLRVRSRQLNVERVAMGTEVYEGTGQRDVIQGCAGQVGSLQKRRLERGG